MRDAEEELVQALRRLVAEAAADDAVRARTHERGLRQAAEEEATLAGTFVDLTERRARLAVRTARDRVHTGVVVAVGRDFAVLHPTGAAPVFVRFAATTSLRVLDGPAEAGGSRRGALAASFAAVVAGLAPERPRVQVASVAGEVFTGVLRSAGVDVCTIHLDGARGDGLLAPMVHVPLAAVADLTLYDL